MVHADLSHELLCTIFMPRTELHDGAVIIRGDSVLAAAALLPLTAMTLSERFGTRHRAALGITEDTDAVAVVVSEENGQMSVVERARIVRVPSEAQLERALIGLLEAPNVPGRGGPGGGVRRPGRLRIARRGRVVAQPAAPPAPAPDTRRRHRNAPTRRARPPPPCRARERGPRPPAPGPGHRAQLAAQAGRGHPRHAAVRRARRVAGQQHVPRARAGDGREPAPQHGHHQPAQGRRADPVHRPGRRRAPGGRGLPRDGRPGRTWSPTAARDRAGQRHRRGPAGDDPRVPAPIHPGHPGPEGVQGGPRRRRPVPTRPRGSWSATSP